jgi:DHA1 family tetracycline resistance protein-like MFS transporter
MQEKLQKNVLWMVVATIFVDMLGYGILIPVIPLLLANPQSPYYVLPAGMTPDQGLILLGFLLAMFPLGQFFATPILGQLSDKYGRKKLLAFSVLGTSFSYILFAIGIVTKNIPLMFFSRALDGVTGGNLSIGQAAIADVTPPEKRSKNFGLIGAAFGFGFIVGPYIGGKLSDPSLVSWFSAATPFYFAAIVAFLNSFFILFLLPETNANQQPDKKMEWGKSLKNIVKAYGMESVRSIFLTNFFFQGGFAFFTSFFAVFLITRFGFSQSATGDFFSYIGVWIVLTQAIITRAVAKYLREDQVIRVSLLMTGYFMLMFFAPKESWQLYLVVPFFAIFNGLSQANTTGLISRSVGREIQGEILGINASVVALAQSIPPILSGFIAASLAAEAPIVVAGLSIIFAGYLFIGLFRAPVVTSDVPENLPIAH